MPDPTIGEAPEGASSFSPHVPQPAHNVGMVAEPTPPGGNPAGGNAASPPSSVTGQARQRLTGALDAQKGAAADKVEEFAQTIQRSAEQFQGRQDWIASAIGRGAEELNAFAGSIRRKDIGDLVGQLQSFAQRQPALFAGAAFAAGFGVARLGKLIAGDLSRDDLPTIPPVTPQRRRRWAMSNADPRAEHTLGGIAGGLASDVQDLVRGELALARAEFDHKLHGLIGGAISLVGAALVAFAGLVVLLEGGAAVLAMWIPTWAALLIVGVVIVAVGGLIARASLAKLSLRNLTPERTAANLQKDGRILKEHL